MIVEARQVLEQYFRRFVLRQINLTLVENVRSFFPVTFDVKLHPILKAFPVLVNRLCMCKVWQISGAKTVNE